MIHSPTLAKWVLATLAKFSRSSTWQTRKNCKILLCFCRIPKDLKDDRGLHVATVSGRQPSTPKRRKKFQSVSPVRYLLDKSIALSPYFCSFLLSRFVLLIFILLCLFIRLVFYQKNTFRIIFSSQLINLEKRFITRL